MGDRDALRIRRLTAVIRHEHQVEAAGQRGITRLLRLIRDQLTSSGMSPDVLDDRHPAWQAAVDEEIEPAITATYLSALREAADIGATDATAYAVRHLETVHNRLVGVADTVFDAMRAELTVGALEGDDIPALTRRVDALLADSDRWRNRARVIARTEVIGAYNAGHHAAAGYHADILGYGRWQVEKEWLATFDTRTRPSHASASGQVVLGLDTAFSVGGASLMQPGDPYGPASEVIQCRCTVLYRYPGDPGYTSGDAAPQADPLAPPPATPDVEDMDAPALDIELADLMSAGDFSSRRFQQIVAEMDRRQPSGADVFVPAEPDALAEARAIEELLSSAPSRRPLEEVLRDEYETWVDVTWNAADEATNGFMMTPAALSQGYTPYDVLTKRIGLKWATPEFQEWVAAHPRMSFPEFRAGAVDDKAAREARWRQRNRGGYESEFG